MYMTDFYVSLIIGVVLTLLFVETLGVTPGGIIVASYLALNLDSPVIILLIILISFITYGVVNFIIPKFVIIYGKRKFVSTLLVAILVKLLLEVIYNICPVLPFEVFEFGGIGVIMPALLANCYSKQGVKLTLIPTLVISVLIFAIMQAIYFVV